MDALVRLAVFEWLEDQVRLHGEVLPRGILESGMTFQGQRVALVGPQGIFKPRICPEFPLSITTTPGGPYSDHFGTDGLLRYAYRGTNPDHRDNIGLREAMLRRAPLVYFHGIVPGRYVAAWPIFIVGDDRQALMFRVALDDARYASSGIRDGIDQGQASIDEAETRARREYVTGTFRRRLHQQAFRDRVLRAYRNQCALCGLRHEELLDAAHIIADSEAEGDPVVRNGLALCKLHHAAFDRLFLAIRPDYMIEVRRDILEEEDGPMLLHGLKGMHLGRILLPRRAEWHPDRDRLEAKYAQFRDRR